MLESKAFSEKALKKIKKIVGVVTMRSKRSFLKNDVNAVFQKCNLRRKVDFGGRGYAVLHANRQISMRQRCTASLTSTIAGTSRITLAFLHKSRYLCVNSAPHYLRPHCVVIKIILAFYAKLDICALSDRVSHPMHKQCTALFMHDQFEGMQNEKNHLAIC